MSHLVLSRKKGEAIYVGDNVIVTVESVRGEMVSIGIEAPKEIAVHRKEIWLEIQKAKREGRAS